nr:HPP family protein [Anaerolineae bacterium]
MAGTPGGRPAQLPEPIPPIAKKTAWTLHPWPRRLPDGIWAPLVAGSLMLMVGGLGLLADNSLFLLPSLGPTIYLQTEDPGQPSSQIKIVIGGHFIGILAGYLAVFALGLASEPSVFELGRPTTARVLAAVIAMVLTE